MFLVLVVVAVGAYVYYASRPIEREKPEKEYTRVEDEPMVSVAPVHVSDPKIQTGKGTVSSLKLGKFDPVADLHDSDYERTVKILNIQDRFVNG